MINYWEFRFLIASPVRSLYRRTLITSERAQFTSHGRDALAQALTIVIYAVCICKSLASESGTSAGCLHKGMSWTPLQFQNASQRLGRVMWSWAVTLSNRFSNPYTMPGARKYVHFKYIQYPIPHGSRTNDPEKLDSADKTETQVFEHSVMICAHMGARTDNVRVIGPNTSSKSPRQPTSCAMRKERQCDDRGVQLAISAHCI